MSSTILAPPRVDRARQVGPVLVFVAWTLFTWVNRIRNVAADPTLHGGDRAWAVAVAVAFIGAAVALAGMALAWAVIGAHPVGHRLRLAAPTLAAVGMAWWAVRGAQILLHDHSLGFKAVHTVLALVTIGLGLVVIRWSRRGALVRGAPRPLPGSLTGDG